MNDETEGPAANDLLAEFHTGFPLTNLRRLLTSEDNRVLRIGTWLASELEPGNRAIFSDIVALLNNEDPEVRLHAVEFHYGESLAR